MFSPLWFCLALIPMSLLLHTSEIGYEIHETKGYHNANTWMSLNYTILSLILKKFSAMMLR